MTKPIVAVRRALQRGDLLHLLELELELDEPLTEKIDLTPEIAANWLAFDQREEGVSYNRGSDERRVERYARDMANDKWYDTGVPIILDYMGHVRDGGHRLKAIIKSGKTIRFNVVFGIEPEAQHVIDRMRPRSVADDMRIAGNPNGMVVQSLVNLVLRWRNGIILSSKWQPTHPEMHELIDQNPLVHDAARKATWLHRNLSNAAKSVTGAMWFEAHQLDEDACDTFFDGLYHGADLPSTSAILALRNTIGRYGANGKKKPRQEEQLYQFAKAWNLWRRKRDAKFIVVPPNFSSDKFPVLV
jgi:hypothetical protein